MRTTSLTFRQKANAAQSDMLPIWLITLAHPDFAGTLRLSSDPTARISSTPLLYGTVSNGLTYQFCPMAVAAPDDIDERGPTARFVIENVGRELITLVRSVTTPGTCALRMVMSATPDVPEADYPLLDLRGVTYNAETITVEVGIDMLELIPYPAGIFAPSGFPGLF